MNVTYLMFLIINNQYTCKICNSIPVWLRTGNKCDILVWHLACAVRKSVCRYGFRRFTHGGSWELIPGGSKIILSCP